jgi:hypothetical protein
MCAAPLPSAERARTLSFSRRCSRRMAGLGVGNAAGTVSLGGLGGNTQLSIC